MSNTVIGFFVDSKRAGNAVSDLIDKGYTDQITVVAKEETYPYIDTKINEVKNTKTEATEQGTLAGAVLGGIAGLLVGTAAVAVPGGVVVMGGIASLILGAGGGATLGAFTGSLLDLGIPQDKIDSLEKRLLSGEVGIIVVLENEKTDEVEEVLNKHKVDQIGVYK